MDDLVNSVKPRYKYTNDVISLLLITSLVAIQSYIVFVLDGELHYVYVIVVLACATWLFGVELLDYYKNR